MEPDGKVFYIEALSKKNWRQLGNIYQESWKLYVYFEQFHVWEFILRKECQIDKDVPYNII